MCIYDKRQRVIEKTNKQKKNHYHGRRRKKKHE